MDETKIAVPLVTSSLDPEVPEKAQRRKFSAEEKKRILEEVDRASGQGGVGAVLRREGIYSSTLHGRRAVNQKRREFVAGSYGSPNRIRTADLLVNNRRLQSL